MCSEERAILQHEDYTWHRTHTCQSSKSVLTADMNILQDFGFSKCLLSLEVFKHSFSSENGGKLSQARIQQAFDWPYIL